jgi:hypothetical protein
VVIGIKRDAGSVAALEGAGFFEALFSAVVAGLAQGLKVQRVEEEFFVSTVAHDVINNRGRGSDFKLKAKSAEGLCLKLASAESFPFFCAVQAHAFIWSLLGLGCRRLIFPGERGNNTR